MAKAPTEIIEYSLYNGEVTVKFYPNSHRYKVTDLKNGLDNVSMKGVTTYLGIKDKSTALQIWTAEQMGLYILDRMDEGSLITEEVIAKAVNLHNENKEEASAIGKKTHDWCEYFIKHRLGIAGYEAEPTLPEEQATLLGVNSFLQFITQHDVEFVASEKIVYSRKHKYIGLMDLKAKVNGNLTSIDFKTSNGLYNTVFAQASAYAKADEEEMEFLGVKDKYENMYALRLAKETKEEYYDRMEKKNRIRVLLGKDPKEVAEYKPFEFRISEGKDSLESNFTEGFLACKALFEWDQKTDFFLNKE